MKECAARLGRAAHSFEQPGTENRKTSNQKTATEDRGLSTNVTDSRGDGVTGDYGRFLERCLRDHQPQPVVVRDLQLRFFVLKRTPGIVFRPVIKVSCEADRGNSWLDRLLD
jgi:hypothetical protein